MKVIDQVAESLIIGSHQIVSTDVFDTLVLRDHSTEIERLAQGCQAAARILNVDPKPLLRLRWSFQEIAYRSVTAEGAQGDASLAKICETIADLLSYPSDAATVLRRTEVDAETNHLRPNGYLIDVLQRARENGKGLIAVSDTLYSADDLARILSAVVGGDTVRAIYSSADVGLTKHAGGLYREVARYEGVAGEMVVHVGDNHPVDVSRARAASWGAVHLPRGRSYALAKALGKVRAVPLGWQRCR